MTKRSVRANLISPDILTHSSCAWFTSCNHFRSIVTTTHIFLQVLIVSTASAKHFLSRTSDRISTTHQPLPHTHTHKHSIRQQRIIKAVFFGIRTRHRGSTKRPPFSCTIGYNENFIRTAGHPHDVDRRKSCWTIQLRRVVRRHGYASWWL